MGIGRAQRTDLLSLQKFTDDELDYLSALIAVAAARNYGGPLFNEIADIDEDITREQSRREILRLRGSFDALQVI